MDADEQLGALAHPGGLLVDRPELTVGVVRAISSPAGLEIELLARRPRDRRTALQRQADIRAGRDAGPVAARHLLPQYDEGEDLRFGWLDGGGRAHWSYPSQSSGSSGGTADDDSGPSLRSVYLLPPLFDDASFVLAWPEIGFSETVVHLTLPDRATAQRDTVSIWQAPVHAIAVPDGSLNHRTSPIWTTQVAIETGRVIAAPRLLHRGEHAAVVLTRLTAVGPVLSLQVRSLARGVAAGSITDGAFAAPMSPIRDRQSGASIAVLQGADALWLRPQEGMTTGGDQSFANTSEFMMSRPDGDVLDLVVAWHAAALPEARVSIPISRP